MYFLFKIEQVVFYFAVESRKNRADISPVRFEVLIHVIIIIIIIVSYCISFKFMTLRSEILGLALGFRNSGRDILTSSGSRITGRDRVV